VKQRKLENRKSILSFSRAQIEKLNSIFVKGRKKKLRRLADRVKKSFETKNGSFSATQNDIVMILCFLSNKHDKNVCFLFCSNTINVWQYLFSPFSLYNNLSIFHKFDLEFSVQMPLKMVFGKGWKKLHCLGTCVGM
jgi:hypothetical protein